MGGIEREGTIRISNVWVSGALQDANSIALPSSSACISLDSFLGVGQETVGRDSSPDAFLKAGAYMTGLVPVEGGTTSTQRSYDSAYLIHTFSSEPVGQARLTNLARLNVEKGIELKPPLLTRPERFSVP